MVSDRLANVKPVGQDGGWRGVSRLQIQDIVKAYGLVPVLRGVNLVIEAGEFFTLLGPSGCGKTTLLRIIAGFLKQDAGAVRIGAEDITAVPPYQRNIGMVFQDYAVFPHLTVADNIGFGLKARRMPREDISRRVAESLEMVRLSGLGARFPSELSGGQQQRVGLARAMAIRPRLLLMDEPLSNLDAKLRIELREDIRDLQRSLGITTIYVTHDQEEALAISDRICVMHAGQAEQTGAPFAIYREPQRRFAAAFIGTMNFIKGEIKSGAAHLGALRLPLGIAAPDGPVEIAIRPENVLIDPAGPDSAGCVRFAANIRKAAFLGREAHCTLTSQHGEIIAQLANPKQDFSALAGKPVTLGLPLARLQLFAMSGERLAVQGAPESASA